MPPKVVVHGAQLRCTMGNKPSNLIVPPGKRIQAENQEVATVEDFQPNTSICPFGMCQSPSNPQVAAAQSPQPCLPNVKVKWAPGGVKVSLTGPASLTEDSKCNCLWGGVISVEKAAQTTVFIGNGVVMGGGVSMGGGGGGGGGGKQQSRSTGATKQPAAANSGPSAKTGANPEDKSETTYFDLWVRLHIDPRKASSIDDVFRLTSSDGAVSLQKTVADDLVPNDDCVDLLFPHLEVEKAYSLEVVEDGEANFVFQNVPGAELEGGGG